METKAIRFFKHPEHGAVCECEVKALVYNPEDGKCYIEVEYCEKRFAVREVYLSEHCEIDKPLQKRLDDFSNDEGTFRAYLIYPDGHYELSEEVFVSRQKLTVVFENGTYSFETEAYRAQDCDVEFAERDVFRDYDRMVAMRHVWYYDIDGRKVETGGFQDKLHDFTDEQEEVMQQIDALMHRAQELGLRLVHEYGNHWNELNWVSTAHFEGRALTYTYYNDDERSHLQTLDVNLKRSVAAGVITYNSDNGDYLALEKPEKGGSNEHI